MSFEFFEKKAAEAEARLAEKKAEEEKTKKAEEKKAKNKAKKQKEIQIVPRGVPNAFLRSALFSAGERKIYNREIIATSKNYEIRFKGEGFNQTDLDLLVILLEMKNGEILKENLTFSTKTVLKKLGGLGTKQRQNLEASMMRFVSGGIEITEIRPNNNKKRTFASTLLKFMRDEETEKHVVFFDKNLIALFNAGHTYINLEQRFALGKSGVAKWLHGHYSSHSEPYPYKVETLWRLCGSQATIYEFRRMIKKSLDDLVKVKFLSEWTITNEVVTVKKLKKPLI